MKCKSKTILRITYDDISFDLSYGQSELIRDIGNNQSGGHDDILIDFINKQIEKNLTEYLVIRKEETKQKVGL